MAKTFNWRQSSPQRTLIALVVGLVLAVVFVVAGGEWVRQNQTDRLAERGQIELNRLAVQVESGITKYEHMPKLLASMDAVRLALRERDDEQIQKLNLELEQINLITEASDSYIMAADGLTIAASNWNQDSPFIGGNFGFRPYFQNAMQGEAARYYALGTTSLKRGYYFSYPVYDDTDIIGVAVVKVDVDEYEIALRNQAYEFVLLDPDGVVFSTSRPEWLYRALEPISESEQQRILESQRYIDNVVMPLPIADQRRYRGVELIDLNLTEASEQNGSRKTYMLQEKPIQLLDFRIAVLSPLTEVTERVQLFRLFSIALVIIVLLVALALFQRRRMVRERNVAMQMSRHNQAYISGIIDNTQAGLVTLDATMRIESFNPTAERLLDYGLNELTQQPFARLLDREDSQRFAALVGRMLADHLTHEHQTIEVGLLHRDGHSIPVELTISDMRLPTVRKFLLTLHDMTERKKYETELQKAQGELERRVKERTQELLVSNQRLRDEIGQHENTQKELIQTAKLAVLGQMSAGINHELNQPLTAIRAFADNAVRFLDKDQMGEARSNMTRISELGQRMGDIIARFKVFSRKGETKAGVVSLSAAVQGALTIMGSRLKQQDIDLQTTVEAETLVQGDTVYLEQVLVNLLANAVDAITDCATTPKRIEIYTEASPTHSDHLIVVVGDNGAGVPVDMAERLFEPFFTTKDAGAGLGLGLSISHRIVEAIGGDIWVRQGRLGGAEFCVRLPLVGQARQILPQEKHA
ncbi:ATP-binding protein [Salinispirillum sp. LH 10-3-1]|uniref:C4-dicarboxylate transport sensor protein DctB n=1 Tax=Salinispirillum sp. LH 10-3-1 TaxID=2952525 RepID=A0AB38YCV3_9GAMM